VTWLSLSHSHKLGFTVVHSAHPRHTRTALDVMAALGEMPGALIAANHAQPLTCMHPRAHALCPSQLLSPEWRESRPLTPWHSTRRRCRTWIARHITAARLHTAHMDILRQGIRECPALPMPHRLGATVANVKTAEHPCSSQSCAWRIPPRKQQAQRWVSSVSLAQDDALQGRSVRPERMGAGRKRPSGLSPPSTGT